MNVQRQNVAWRARIRRCAITHNPKGTPTRHKKRRQKKQWQSPNRLYPTSSSLRAKRTSFPTETLTVSSQCCSEGVIQRPNDLLNQPRRLPLGQFAAAAAKTKQTSRHRPPHCIGFFNGEEAGGTEKGIALVLAMAGAAIPTTVSEMATTKWAPNLHVHEQTAQLKCLMSMFQPGSCTEAEGQRPKVHSCIATQPVSAGPNEQMSVCECPP
jgi:hypothetical protein